MDNIINLVPTELIGVVVALYFIGLMLKQTTKVSDNIIPLILTVIGIVLSVCITVIGKSITVQAIANAIIQGIICTGISVYCNQLIKQ